MHLLLKEGQDFGDSDGGKKMEGEEKKTHV
jgi:hypothetical protein